MNELKEQIEKTLRKLELGEIHREDRIFLNHVLEQFQYMVTIADLGVDIDDVANEMIGSTRELVEDGLVEAWKE